VTGDIASRPLTGCLERCQRGSLEGKEIRTLAGIRTTRNFDRMKTLFIFNPQMEELIDPELHPMAIPGQVVKVESMIGDDTAFIATPGGDRLGMVMVSSLSPILPTRKKTLKYDPNTGHTAESLKNIS